VSEIRLSDVIKALGQAPPSVGTSIAESPIANPSVVEEEPTLHTNAAPVPVASTPAPEAILGSITLPPAPAPQTSTPPAKSTALFSVLDAMIETASDEPQQALPSPEPKAVAMMPAMPTANHEAERKHEPAPVALDDSHSDPLIRRALEIFGARIITT
jgi:hypothetical protein